MATSQTQLLTTFLHNRALEMLCSGLERMHSTLHRAVVFTSAREAAIEALRDGSASPDMCDWAERHLCGMVDQNPARYLERRRWQS
jgi:hypothetical protein